MRRLRLALAQINATVGDLDGNTQKIVHFIEEARRLGADLVAFPEQAIPGYPAEDLLLKPSFIRDNMACLEQIVGASAGIGVIVGFAHAKGDLYNAAAVIRDGELRGVYHKMFLPNYGVFDENRYFQAGTEPLVFFLGDIGIGVNICEDIWYSTGPTTLQAYADAEVIISINASPFSQGKRQARERMLATRAVDNLAIVAYVNMVGGQDELVFDGGSMVCDEQGNVIALGQQFEEDLIVCDLDLEAVFRSRLHDPRRRQEKLLLQELAQQVQRVAIGDAPSAWPKPSLPPREETALESVAEVYEALVLGTRDYMHKNGFRSALIGLSGGVDSSLVAAIAADALGPENVIGVIMPSRFSARQSRADALRLARNLSIGGITIPIEPAFRAYLRMLAPQFKDTPFGAAEENLQARIRGNLLMALSNKFGHLVLTTGNKSEMATGYATLYGDMAGGFAVIKDVPKMLVYELARYRNARGEAIPERVLTREPTAELRPNQRDADTLPPYPILDPILRAYVEEDRSLEEIVALGFDEATVRRVIAMVDGSEYKRRQAPPGVKITLRAFGRDRRLPIVNRYRRA